MEPALADTAPALSVALKMGSCMVYTDRRPVPFCASVANRERRSHDEARSSKQLPRSPGHVTSSQLIAYACHNHSIMISCKHGTFWRGSRAWIAGPRGFSNGNAYIFDRWRLPRRSRADTGCAHTCKMTYHGTCSLQECTRLINRQEEAAPESTVRTWTRADHPIQRNLRFNLRT